MIQSKCIMYTCSFLTTSWNFLLLHVRWLNNSQSCLLPPCLYIYSFFLSNGDFFNFFRQFQGGKFCCYHIMERIHQPKCFSATCLFGGVKNKIIKIRKQGFTGLRLAFTDSAFDGWHCVPWPLSSIFDKHGVIILFVYCLLQVV